MKIWDFGDERTLKSGGNSGNITVFLIKNVNTVTNRTIPPI